MTPGVTNANAKDEEEDDVELDAKHTTMYRAAAARGNFLSQDRFDTKFAVKELSRRMAKPRNKDWRKLIRLAKYLIGRERFVVDFLYQESINKIDVWTDTDYAGCRETRKSTSGGVIMLGKHIIKGWSATQKVIALSSGEAEYYGCVKGSAEAIGSQSILADMGVNVRIRLSEDSTAAKGIADRTGLGKVRHIEVNQLWLQEKVRNKDIELRKVKGLENLAM